MSSPGELELLVMLAILRRAGNAYGVTIREELERETSRSVSLGTVYKTTARLESKGYVLTRFSEPIPERGGRRKKLYELSSAGREAVVQSLADLASLARGLLPEVGAP